MRNSKSPSIHSIYQNALPFYHDRADLALADVREAEFAGQCLEQLLNGNLTLQIDASNTSADKLRHIYFEAKNYERTAGPKTFGLGYPLLIDSHEGELLVAPLFIWQLNIEPAQAKVDSWVIRFSEEGHLMPNQHVIRHLKRKFDLDWGEKMDVLASAKKMGKASLSEFCRGLAERLQLDEQKGEGNAIPTPGIDAIGNLTEKGTLHWSGVFGLYPPQYTYQIDEELKPEDVFVSEKIKMAEGEMIFPYTPCDPEQMTAIELVSRHSMSVVEGVDALGKTQTVLNLLVNALANGQKCLVVSERAQALKKTQGLLSKSGLHQFHFLLDDDLNDKVPMLELLRVLANGAEFSHVFNHDEYEKKKAHFIGAAKKLNQSYRAVKQKIFGENNWTDVVGLFLESQQKEGKELLAADLNAAHFAFSYQEHSGLVQKIEICRSSFSQVGTLTHPLTILHHRFFTGGAAEEELEKVQPLLDKFLQKGKQLQHRYLNETDAYAADLKSYYMEEYRNLDGLIVLLDGKIKMYSNEYGDKFREAGSGGLNLGMLFSSKKKKVGKAQKEVAKDYETLLAAYGRNRHFEFEPQPDKNGMHISKVIENISAFRNVLENWKGRIDSTVLEEVKRLNSKTAHPALGIKEQITELEYSLDLFIEELNEAGLFQKPFENKTLTIPQRKKYLESILSQLQSSQLNLRDFPAFHQWQRNWLALSELEQKVVRALINVHPNDWKAAFESWYFHNILSQHETPPLKGGDQHIAEYAEKWHSLKPLIFKRIESFWKNRQMKSLKALKRKDRKAYQQVFTKSGFAKTKGLPLKRVLDSTFEVVSDLLPLLFVTPHIALNVLPEDFQFDLVLFEESNRFSVEMATALAKKGKRVAIFGSDDNNGSETSLLQYALASGVPSAKITNLYEVPEIASLSAEGAGQVFHFANEYHVENLEGRFHEMEGTNDIEAQHIIRLLNQVKQTPQRVYPTVGIVTFTVEQRDLISSYLLKLKQQNSAASEKIRHLERNGMGVYFSEEVFGQHFDILILSGTFGLVNLKGELTKRLMFLNTPEGLSHLQLLINKPLQQLFLVHSIPDAVLEKFKGKKYEGGTWLFAHFIQLAEAYRDGNERLVGESMEAIGKKEIRKAEPTVFAGQVKNMLASYFDHDRFGLAKPYGDILLPLTLKGRYADQPDTAILTDVFLADTEHTSGIWEYHRVLDLSEIGYVHIPVSSIDWFQNAGVEARRLASRLIKSDDKFLPIEGERKEIE